jgi:hypothetical protein
VAALAGKFGFEWVPAPLAFALPCFVGTLPEIAEVVAVQPTLQDGDNVNVVVVRVVAVSPGHPGGDSAAGGIVRARRGEALFVELEEGDEAQPIPSIAVAAQLGTATLTQWANIIRRFGLPAMEPDTSVEIPACHRFGESLLSGWRLRVKQGEPVLLRVPLFDLQIFGHRAALLFNSVNALRGQVYPLKQLLRVWPQYVVAPYLDNGGSLPTKAVELSQFAYRVVETIRQEAVTALNIDNAFAANERGAVWDFPTPGWWEIMVLATLQGRIW